jgi:hypothetical protein
MELQTKLDALLKSIELLLSNKQHGPALILIYSTTDILAWLGRNKAHIDVERSDFLTWVEKYLLPFLNVNIAALDLYSARCSILHSYSAESRLSRNQEAIEIFYAWGTANSEDLQAIIDSTDRKAVALQTEQLVKGLRIGIHKFLEEFPDGDLLSRRNEKLFASVPL